VGLQEPRLETYIDYYTISCKYQRLLCYLSDYSNMKNT